jgi:hypothetical protein
MRTENGERRTENGERRTENGEERAMVLDVTKVGDGYHESVPPGTR